MIQIFCINLKRATERKEQTTYNWINNLGFEINFWEAYDKKNIENNKHIYDYTPENSQKFLGRQLSSGEIACSTSYCLLFEFLIKNNYNEVIIIEDDVKPIMRNKNELYDIIDIGKNEFIDCDMMIFHKFNKSIEKIPIHKKRFFSKYKIIPWGNYCLYMNKKAIEEVYTITKKLIWPADNSQKILHENGVLNIIVSNQPKCKHINLTTYIGTDLRFEKNKRRLTL